MCTKKLVTLLLSLLLVLSNTIFGMDIQEYLENMRNEQRTKHTEEVKKFIANSTAYSESYGSKLLFDAIYYEISKTILALLQCNVNPNYENKQHGSILKYASNHLVNMELVTILLKHGANPTLKGNQGSLAAKLLGTRMHYSGGPLFDITKFLEVAQENWIHSTKNEFIEIRTNIFKTYPTELSLIYNVLFAVRSKKRFKEFENIIKDKLDLTEEFFIETASPQLLKHFLECGIFTWNDKMLEKFLGRDQRRDLMRYKYHDTSIARIPYDIDIIY